MPWSGRKGGPRLSGVLSTDHMWIVSGRLVAHSGARKPEIAPLLCPVVRHVVR